MRKPLANKRARYYELIWKYKQRRELLRVRYPPERLYPFKRGVVYNKTVIAINKKIKSWRRQMKKIDEVTNKIISLGNAVAYFTGRNVKDSGRCSQDDKQMKLARYIFYKWGLENKIEGKLLREYVGAKRIAQPAEYRLSFNTDLRNKHSVRQTWLNFCDYYKNFPVTRDDYIDNRKVKG